MSPEHQLSRENATFQVFEALKNNRRQRSARHEIFVEGVAALNAARRGGMRARAVLYQAGRRLSGWAVDTIDSLAPQNRYALAADLMARLSDREEPSELVAVLPQPAYNAEDYLDAYSTVLVDRPSGPGNLGALVRSADAFGVGLVLIAGHAVDPFDPQALRAARGALLTIPVVHSTGTAALVDFFAQKRRRQPALRVIGTDSAATHDLSAVDLGGPLVVCFGNEATGLSVALRAVVDDMVRIPITGFVDSLNVACAATVVLHQHWYQRCSRPAVDR